MKQRKKHWNENLKANQSRGRPRKRWINMVEDDLKTLLVEK